MQVAYGDFGWSNYASAVEAGTIGASAYTPALDAIRTRDEHLLYGVPGIPSYPYHGSAIVIWDSGPGLVDPPALTNTPPSGPHDPHLDPPATVAAPDPDLPLPEAERRCHRRLRRHALPHGRLHTVGGAGGS